MTDKLQIDVLKLSDMCTNPAIVIIAKRGSGKTWVCRSLLDHFKDIPVGIIISHTETVDPFFQTFFPATFIFDKYDPKIFERIMTRQHAIKDKAEVKKQQGKKIDTRLFLLMDDCLSSSKEWSRDENLKSILFDGRHFDITYILTMQAPLGIVPELRSNFDYVLLMSSDTYSEIKKFYEHYTGMFPNLNAFKEVYDRLTVDHGCMVVKKRGANCSLNEKIFHYKASDKTPRMIGCKQLIKYHEKNYDANWAKRQYMRKFNIADFTTKRNIKHFDVEKLDMHKKPIYDQI